MQLNEIDFTDLDNFAAGFPHELFAVHRREAPVFWHESTGNTPDGEGFWSVATYAETLAVLRDPGTYSSVTGGDRPYGGTVLQDLPIAGQVLNMMDDPRHARIRRLVSSGLTPRMIRRVEDDLRSRTRALLAGVTPGEGFDFVTDVAAELPMQMICILLGVPESDRHLLAGEIASSFDFGGARKAEISRLPVREAGSPMRAYGSELIAAKRAAPGEDMLSVVANAVEPLTDAEVYLFFSLLFSAGAETTRNAIAGGLLALAGHPGAYRRLRAEPGLITGAVEEIVRWTTPSPSKRRTATSDTTLGGRHIRAGQKVLVWEGSANRDGSVFTDPGVFDIGRKPNPTWVSGRACTSAWERTWPAWSCGCSSRNCWPGSPGWRYWAHRNGPAATATPDCGTSTSPSPDPRLSGPTAPGRPPNAVPGRPVPAPRADPAGATPRPGRR